MAKGFCKTEKRQVSTAPFSTQYRCNILIIFILEISNNFDFFDEEHSQIFQFQFFKKIWVFFFHFSLGFTFLDQTTETLVEDSGNDDNEDDEIYPQSLIGIAVLVGAMLIGLGIG